MPCGITATLDEQTRRDLIDYCDTFISTLKAAGVLVRGDYRDNYTPGWKFNHWELKVGGASKGRIVTSS